jgi:hypothetical protein
MPEGVERMARTLGILSGSNLQRAGRTEAEGARSIPRPYINVNPGTKLFAPFRLDIGDL